MKPLWIFLPPEACQGVSPELPVQWVAPGESRTLSLADALSDLPAHWQLVLPVEAVTACAVQLPTQKARWVRQALPFAVEELLAEDVESMHLALGEQLADGRHRVYALRADWLRDCLALFAAQPPQAIRMDADMLPHQGSQLLWLQSRWVLGARHPGGWQCRPPTGLRWPSRARSREWSGWRPSSQRPSRTMSSTRSRMRTCGWSSRAAVSTWHRGVRAASG